MEWEIRKGRFIEHGEFAGNIYGTSIDSVKALMSTGYTAVLTPHPHALKMLRTSDVSLIQERYLIWGGPDDEPAGELRLSVADYSLNFGMTDV